MIYKTLAIDRETKKASFIELDCSSKKWFIRNLRANGYMVNPKHVLTKKSYDYVIENTNCTKWDWREYTEEQMASGMRGIDIWSLNHKS